jgi:hypothetical protein
MIINQVASSFTRTGYHARMDVIAWLLEGDPAIRWQVMRDLIDAEPETVAAERARVVREGLGAAILARQGADGAWHRADEPDWLPTLHMSTLLLATGADPGDPVFDAAVARLATGFRWHEEFGAMTFFEGEVEPCINGRALALGGYTGRQTSSLAQRLLDDQLDDGGWNCDAPRSQRSSFHSTICVLEGLLAYERAVGAEPSATAARERGADYLLARGMFRRRSTGDIADPGFLLLSFPSRYRYDVLRGLDYLRDAGVAPDERVDDAVQLIRDRRQVDGRWLLDASYTDGIDVSLGESLGEPSRWNTLRALRALRWYDSRR